MKKLVFILIIQFIALPLFAHDTGHGIPSKEWGFSNSNETIKADFIKKIGETVYLSNDHHEVLIFDFADFKKEEQQYILERAQWIESKNTVTHNESNPINRLNWVLIIGFVLLLVSLFMLKKKNNALAYGFLGAICILLGCKNVNIVKGAIMAANNVSFLESVFGSFEKVSTSYDDEYFYVASDGIPEHTMMTGITNWQQQVPINHDYTGTNSWAIPLQPALSENPLSTKDNFMKGAIAIAANGIPIFNPLNNRGEDANEIGELDKWGGHCGRADDYHYHLAPSHLQSKVGGDKPIAYALDGFPVYGETTEELDESLGRFTSDSTYQYHAVKEYPYLIASMRGKVKMNPSTQAPENEITPQARTRGVRPDLRPLRGAEIIDFKERAPQQYTLTYKIDSEVYIINYGWDDEGNYKYEFVNPDGTSESSTYKRKK